MSQKLKKRILFGEEEKSFVKKLIIKNKEIIESKKSDAETIIAKKKCWESITNQFNSTGRFPLRTVAQLRKLWENVKSRNKGDLTSGKKERMKTCGPLNFEVADVPYDSELDSAVLGINFELPNAVGSDPLATSPSHTRNSCSCQKPREETSKFQRNEQFTAHEDELHALKVQESKLRISLLNKELEIKNMEAVKLAREMEQGEELFELKKKCYLEQQLKEECSSVANFC